MRPKVSQPDRTIQLSYIREVTECKHSRSTRPLITHPRKCWNWSVCCRSYTRRASSHRLMISSSEPSGDDEGAYTLLILPDVPRVPQLRILSVLVQSST